jgi:hypothetical protein
VTYRDLGSNPLPHFDAATGLARLVPPEQRTPAQAASRPGSTTSSRPDCRTIPRPRPPCSAAASSSYSPAAAGATPKAHPDTGGTTRNHGFRTPSRSPAWNLASRPRRGSLDGLQTPQSAVA